MELKLYTEIALQAPVEQVWQILTDFEKYPDWNPFIVSVVGNLTADKKLTVKIKPPGSNPQTFRSTVLKVVLQREIRWAGVFLLSCLFRGEHYFILEKIDANTTKLVHGEIFSGALVRFFANHLKGAVYAGFVEMNRAIEKRILRDAHHSRQ